MGGIHSVGGKGTKLWLVGGSVRGKAERHALGEGGKLGTRHGGLARYED
jgi:hypothetical protein